jgi:hypothetical protein
MEMTLNTDQAPRLSLAGAQTVTREFLAAALSDVQRVDVTKITPTTSGMAAWEAEAEVWQPNAMLKSLGLETGRPVLDHHHYLVRLDATLNVLEYALEGS